MGVLDRLKRRREFLVVAGQGRRWAAPGLILQARPRDPACLPAAPAAAPASGSSPTPTPPRRVRPDRHSPDHDAIRVGFTVSRKVGKAVVRNRVRRRLKAAAAIVLPAHARIAYDYVLIGRQQTMTRPFPALLQDLETALRKVGAHRGVPGGKLREAPNGAHREAPNGAGPAGDGAKGVA